MAPPAAVLPLTTSFRNDQRVLDVANHVSDPLRTEGIDVGVLVPGPVGRAGDVRCALLPTVDDEARWLADAVAAIWAEDAPVRARRGTGRSIAVLARRRALFPRIERALRGHGIPVELVGLGGLLATPEVRDVVSTLQVLSDPTAGGALVRLLSGPRWSLGPRDLAALGRRARALARTRRRTDAGTAGPEPYDTDPVDDASLVEALDALGPPEGYSAEGYQRLRAFSRELDLLRRRTAAPLPELVADVERTLGLDVEVVAAGGSRVHLDRFLDVAATFAEDAELATLGSFLAYLDAAETEERGLEAGEVQVDGDRVQVLTVHAAKGLEWDVVAVPGLTAKVFPDAKAVAEAGWTSAGGRAALPAARGRRRAAGFDVSGAGDQKEVEDRRAAFATACGRRGELEERRLAYVAVTRARQLLLCSGYWWDDHDRRRGARRTSSPRSRRSPASRGRVGRTPGRRRRPTRCSNVDRSAPWPVDPLGARRARVAEGAELVRAALGGPDEVAEPAGQGALFEPAALDPGSADWDDDVTLLLAERDRSLAGGDGGVDVELPDHLSVSALTALRRSPGELARRIRRPMPARPAPLARRGTAFHAWLEERFGGERLLDLDELPGAADEGAVADADLADLQQAFLASPWAQRRPVEVEVPFETRVGNLLVRGRMDAVFGDGDGGYTVVDWKTGEQPTGQEMRAAAVQLAAYRVAWAELAEVGVDRVRAAFHYVRSGNTVAPADLLDHDALADLVTALPG